MKFQIIAAAVTLSLLATPSCKQLECGENTVEEDGKCISQTKCGTGTVEKDGECVIPKPPKPKGCGEIVLTPFGLASYTLVKATRKGSACTVTLKAKSFHKDHMVAPSQYDKDGVKLSEGMSRLGELNAGESGTMEFYLKKGATKIKIHPN